MFKTQKEALLFKLFNILGYEATNIDELLNITLSQDSLKSKELTEKLYIMIENLKNEYKSQKLTCLHKNSLEKQKFPALNMIRQICKCNSLYVTPFVVCKGYDKASGRKITERYYSIKMIDS
tara:strand:+ start:138 stop:503 length:366 start_codon:yes stop_codon:yes gene_type:complete